MERLRDCLLREHYYELSRQANARHVMSIDLECPERILSQRFLGVARPPSPHVVRGTHCVLELLAAHNTLATFFVLGSVAHALPALVRRIADAGHEIALHGLDHEPLARLTPAQFRAALRRAKEIVEDIIGTPVVGHRSPYLSLTKATSWALDVLREERFSYDSSAFPMLRRIGRMQLPSTAFRLENGLIEIPVGCVSFFGCGLPVGGGYLRNFPLWWTRLALRRAAREGRPLCLYTHPYEFDAGWADGVFGPRPGLKLLVAITSTTRNAGALHAAKFERLLAGASFQTARELAQAAGARDIQDASAPRRVRQISRVGDVSFA